MKQLIIAAVLFVCASAASQTQAYLDSLKQNPKNEIMVFQDDCTGCIVTNPPCEAYLENQSKSYVIWKNDKGFNMRRFSVCGASKTFSFSSWPEDPFNMIKAKKTEFDNARLQYPMAFSEKDSAWHEINVDHYKYYNFSFMTSKLRNIDIMDYAFSPYGSTEMEIAKNTPRLKYNNESAVKKLLDIVMERIEFAEKKKKF